MSPRLARTVTGMTAGVLVVTLLGLGAPSAATAGRTAAPDGVLDVLVLGDSYSAGNGASDQSGDQRVVGPQGCRRSEVAWSGSYAAALRSGGQPVRLANHACSGGVTADLTAARVMDTSRRVQPTPSGVSTRDRAEASLRRQDPCNTRRFPAEEFWTYRVTVLTPVATTFECTRHLRPQADFVTPASDLVLLTMGGNDAGFSTIVQHCFVPVARTARGCEASVQAARALLPHIQQRLVTGLGALRDRGLRDDARIVQLGYPRLQLDNDFRLTDATGTYAAGDEVRALVDEGNAAIAAAVPAVNIGRTGQMTFLDGVPQEFSGHEPDATTPIGNDARWINQVADGAEPELWYHPNRLGHAAYARLLAARGTFGAPTDPPSRPEAERVQARLAVGVRPRRATPGSRVRVQVRAALSDDSRPRGTVVVRALPSGRRLASTTLRRRDEGATSLTVRLRGARTDRVRVTYDDRNAPPVSVDRRVRRAGR